MLIGFVPLIGLMMRHIYFALKEKKQRQQHDHKTNDPYHQSRLLDRISGEGYKTGKDIWVNDQGCTHDDHTKIHR